MELFGQTEFPPIGDLPYFITLGPHGFYWFKLENVAAAKPSVPEELPLPTLEVTGAWEQVLARGGKSSLEKILSGYINKCRWFGGKGRKIRAVTLGDPIPVPVDSQEAQMMAMEVSYADGEPEAYLLSLAFVTGDRAGEFQQASAQGVIARLKAKHAGEAIEGLLIDAIYDREFLKYPARRDRAAPKFQKQGGGNCRRCHPSSSGP